MSKTFLGSALFIFFIIISTFLFSPAEAKKKKKKNGHKIKVLLIDGQSKSHDHWKEWTPILLKQLHDAGRFQLDVATAPMKGESLDKFNPKFKKYGSDKKMEFLNLQQIHFYDNRNTFLSPCCSNRKSIGWFLWKNKKYNQE